MAKSLSATVDAVSWVTVCDLAAIAPNTGVTALVGTEQVAIFRIGQTNEVYAVSNYDPFSKAFVISRGIVGDRQGVLKVASPIYKQNFSLKTGVCLDDEAIAIPTYPVKVIDSQIQVGVNP